MKKIAVVHPEFSLSGGSDAAAAWTVNALQNEYEVTVITLGHPTFGALNKSYGTEIEIEKVRVTALPFPFLLGRFDALRGYPVARYVRKHASDFDLVISTYSVFGWEKRGILFIADFSFDDRLRRSLYTGAKGWRKNLYSDSLLRRIYLSLGRKLSGISGEGWRNNRIVANSFWTAEILKKNYGLDSSVVYPPVTGQAPDIPWNRRNNGFVWMGRLAPQKGVAEVIRIIKRLRGEGEDIHLHLLGRAVDPSYERELKDLVGADKAGIFFEGPCYGEEKWSMLARHKYGISACRNEAFGIGVAEMVKSGNIVFVTDSGGQVEIPDFESLTFRSEDDAFRKITDVIGDSRLQEVCRRHLSSRILQFSTGSYEDAIRKIVRDFFEHEEL
jgi:glycosyltransferase involved in cell wall biosynthesis